MPLAVFFLFGFLNYAKANETWHSIGSGIDGYVSDMIVFNDELYIGGKLTSLNCNFAKWNGISWTPLSQNSGVQKLAIYRNELYATGTFDPSDFVAKWNGTSWIPLDSGINDETVSIGVFNDELFVGGFFTRVNGMNISNIAKWNGASWSKAGDLDSFPESFAIYNNEFYAVGGFSKSVAKWNGGTWVSVGYGNYKYPFASAVFNNELYVGGGFPLTDGAKIAKYNGSAWTVFGGKIDGQVNTLLVFDNELYMGGTFTLNGSHIAKWNGTEWIGLENGMNANVQSLIAYQDKLYAGGYASPKEPSKTDFLAGWYDSTAPETIAMPKGGIYDVSQKVVLTPNEEAKTYYTIDGTIPTISSQEYTNPIVVSESTNLNFFSIDRAGNQEEVKTEKYLIAIPIKIDDPIDIINPPAPDAKPIVIDRPVPVFSIADLYLSNVELYQIYHNQQKNIEISFYKLPKRSVIKKYYFKLTQNKKKFLGDFNKKNSYRGYVKLLSNLGTVEKAYAKDLDKRVKLKISIHYSKRKLTQNSLKEKNLRLFVKDRNNNWRGPYRIYQNTSTHKIKFKVRNYLVKKPKSIAIDPLNDSKQFDLNLSEKLSGNRTFAPIFYFQTIEKIKFVIADKNALKN